MSVQIKVIDFSSNYPGACYVDKGIYYSCLSWQSKYCGSCKCSSH